MIFDSVQENFCIMDKIEQMNLKWNLLREKVKKASEMPVYENGRGMKIAYQSVLKLMDMLDDGDELEDIVFDNGLFKRSVNILSL